MTVTTWNTLLKCKLNASDEIKIPFTVTEYILGLPLEETGIFPSLKTDGPNHVIQYGVTLVMSSHNPR